MDCCFDLGASCNTHVSFPVTTRLKKFSPSSLYRVRKSNILTCRFNLCSSVSIFGTQRAHNFRNLSLSDTISWRSDSEIWGKCKESGVMVNRLFSLIFSWTVRTTSSFTTDGRPLRRSPCTFSCLSLNSRTHLRTIEVLMACSPYTSQSWRWISAGFLFFAFKKRITDRISHAAGFFIFLSIINTQHDAWILFDCVHIASVPCHRINKLGSHLHHRNRSAAVAIFANGTYFLDNPRIIYRIWYQFCTL